MNIENIPSQIGEYTVESKLGEGAMGVVYKAHVGKLTVAIKVISPEIAGDREFVQRFLREMQVVSTLDHPNIVKAVDFGVDVGANIYFVALEYIDGESLKDLLVREKRLSLDRALKITRQIALGLDYAFSNGIVHRDIKPDNILLTSTEIAKIADFGLVKSQSQSSITQTGTILGTPFYLAPEQAFADKAIDIRADIYSLGITLYHMLCGRPPFVFDNPMKVITAHCYTPLPSISDYVSNLPIPILQLVDKMTEKERDNRISSPPEIVEAIDTFLAHGTIPSLSAVGGADLDDGDYEEAPTRMFQGEVPPPQQGPPQKKSTVKVDHHKFTSSQKKSQEEDDSVYLYISMAVVGVIFILVVVVGYFVFKNYL